MGGVERKRERGARRNSKFFAPFLLILEIEEIVSNQGFSFSSKNSLCSEYFIGRVYRHSFRLLRNRFLAKQNPVFSFSSKYYVGFPGLF